MAAQINANVSNQTVDQTNINEQKDRQEINNQSKEENIQDYVTYIRTTDRNTTEMINNLKANLQALSKMKMNNKMDVTGCLTVKKDAVLEQENKAISNVTAGIQALQNITDKLKQSAKTDSQTDITGSQTASGKQAGEAGTEQGNDQSQESGQEVEQKSGFITLGRLSPVRVSESFTTLLNKYRSMNSMNRNRGNMNRRRAVSTARTTEHYSLIANNNRTKTSRTNERFCFVGCVNVNLSNQEIKQRNENRQESEKILNNNSEIKNKISSAYDKIAEVINETKKTEEKAMEAKASADVNMSNELNLGLDPIKMAELAKANAELVKAGGQAMPCQQVFEGNLTIKQKNELELMVELEGMIEQITQMDEDQETAAIMADMIGLTQSGTVEQAATGKTKQTSKQGNKAKQTTEQTAGGLDIAGVIVILVILYVLYKLLSVGIHPWFYVVSDKIDTLAQQSLTTNNTLLTTNATN